MPFNIHAAETWGNWEIAYCICSEISLLFRKYARIHGSHLRDVQRLYSKKNMMCAGVDNRIQNTYMIPYNSPYLIVGYPPQLQREGGRRG